MNDSLGHDLGDELLVEASVGRPVPAPAMTALLAEGIASDRRR